MDVLINVLEQGLIFSIAAFGVYITYKILDFPDLSVDGTFPLGAAITAVCLMKGVNPFAACALSFAFGCIGGLLTGILHVRFKITNLLSGILIMIALYSINLRIMSKSNIPLFGKQTIFSNNVNVLVVVFIFMIAVKIALDMFLKTKLGFVLKAVGDNDQLVTSLGINKDNIKIIGLMLSNGLVALAGSMMAQYQGFSDVGMGTGIVVMGLAAVIMGESVFGKIRFMQATTMALIGSILYKGAIALALTLGLPSTDLKLITALIVVIALSLNGKKLNFKPKKNLEFGGGTVVKDTKAM
ncbi:ABC transporter permease [Clostridium magnum]|uniref:Ribose ABC transporter permease protein n=1 Tax=Clostridium magnum DSM 2767 TaxID=1121326 RepID=A0A162TC71_9CLOT|nr:ABC transporter [Clostridium magnum]KZL92457.1 ribose ABC transporter permease protein [Clostridium magnum DSM 2767]SHI26609.1 putative ABC transport system permease protein [Clostridium magnum DSM 2767]